MIRHKVSTAGWKGVRWAGIAANTADWSGMRRFRQNGQHGRMEGSDNDTAYRSARPVGVESDAVPTQLSARPGGVE